MRLQADLADAAPASTKKRAAEIPRFHLSDGELWLGESRFQPGRATQLQLALWSQRLGQQERPKVLEEYRLEPPVAVYQMLETLGANEWLTPQQLDGLAKVFTGQEVDCDAVCQAGWLVGMLAQREADGKTWYRPAPTGRELPPHKYLSMLDQERCVAVDLSQVPLAALGVLGQLGDLSTNSPDSRSLRLTPNLVRMGRATDKILGSEQAGWLFQQSPARQVDVRCPGRARNRGNGIFQMAEYRRRRCAAAWIREIRH